MSSMNIDPASSVKMSDPRLADSSSYMPAFKATKMHIKDYPFMAPPPGLTLDDDEEKVTDECEKQVIVDEKSEKVEDVLEDNSDSEDAVASSGDTQDASRGSEAHENGECKPCAYFWTQSDGCRRGNECDFCHLCDSGALKTWKKEKKQRKKAEARLERERRLGARMSRRRRQERALEGFQMGVPAHVHMPRPVPLDASFCHPMPMMMATMPEMAAAQCMPAIPAMPMMPGMPAMPTPLKAPATPTKLSVLSRPYLPADLVKSYTKAVTSALANVVAENEAGDGAVPQAEKILDVAKVVASEVQKGEDKSSEIAKAVASEVEKLVEVSYDVIAAEKLLNRLQADLTSPKSMHEPEASPKGYNFGYGKSMNRVPYW